jgi:hypothetical protein
LAENDEPEGWSFAWLARISIFPRFLILFEKYNFFDIFRHHDRRQKQRRPFIHQFYHRIAPLFSYLSQPYRHDVLYKESLVLFVVVFFFFFFLSSRDGLYRLLRTLQWRRREL